MTAETFTPEHVDLLQGMFQKAARKVHASKGSSMQSLMVRQFLHWSVRFGMAIYANSPSERLLKSIESSRKALKDGPTS